jgi:hypothetical protein
MSMEKAAREAASREAAKAEREKRQQAEGAFIDRLYEHVHVKPSPFRLGGEAYRCVSPAEVPGYSESDDDLTLLRRESDGMVYELDIAVTLRVGYDPALEAAKQAAKEAAR